MPSPAPAAPSALLRELMAERNWPEVRIESARVLASVPDDETARLGEALSLPFTQARERLEALASHARDALVRASAAYQLGVHAQVAGDARYAWRCLRTAFLAGGSESITLRSAWRMEQIATPATLTADETAILPQLHTVASCAGRDTRRLCQAEDAAIQPASGVFSAPARMIVAFYKRAVAPAIGSRCSLTPSCSAYFLEASRKHGLLGFPMLADRLVREPSEVLKASHPVRVGRKTRYADPVEAHDFWW